MPKLTKAALDLIERQRLTALETAAAIEAAEDEMDPPADYDPAAHEYDPYV